MTSRQRVLLSCAVAAFVSTWMPWSAFSFPEFGGADEPDFNLFSRQMTQSLEILVPAPSAWNGSIHVLGVVVPNWLASLSIATSAMILWMRSRAIVRGCGGLALALLITGSIQAAYVAYIAVATKGVRLGLGVIVCLASAVVLARVMGLEASITSKLEADRLQQAGERLKAAAVGTPPSSADAGQSSSTS